MDQYFEQYPHTFNGHKLINFFQKVHHRLKILRQGRFPDQRCAGAGVGDPQAPGVEELAVHQGFEARELGVARHTRYPAAVGGVPQDRVAY